MIEPSSIHALQMLTEDYKFWLTLVSMFVAAYRIFTWVKEIRTKDLKEIHAGIQELKTATTGLGTKLDTQTNLIVGELKELRNDFRTFIPMGMYMSPVAAKPVTKRTRTPKRKPVNTSVSMTVTKDLQSV